MNNQTDVRETIYRFCRAWFEERNLTETLTFLTEDVDFVGTGKNESAWGKAEMEAYLSQDIREISEPFKVGISFIYEHFITEQVCSLSAEVTLKNTLYTWNLKAFFTLLSEESRWVIKSFHVAEPGTSQREAEHYPQALVMEHSIRQRQELLNDSLPGGMMGGYIEEGFPL